MHLMEWLKKPGFHRLTEACEGARVMLTRNSEGRQFVAGAVNGATGVIKGFEMGPPEKIHQNAGLPPSIVKKIFVDLDCGVSITVRRSITESRQDGMKSFTKSTFPLALGYAMTGHKAQGATISGEVVIHATHSFCPGLMYVMLSRVNTSQQLKFTSKPTVAMFKPMLCPGM
jgi:ATP-dependent exoDNAse (exonuclease V) alpha subunit